MDSSFALVTVKIPIKGPGYIPIKGPGYIPIKGQGQVWDTVVELWVNNIRPSNRAFLSLGLHHTLLSQPLQ